MWLWSIIGITAIVVAITKYLIFVYTKSVITDKLKTCNYRGQYIPGNTGIIFPAILLHAFVINSIVYQIDFFNITILLSLLSFFAIYGLMDDLCSDKQKGLFGHINLLIIKGVVTSGIVKAWLGIMTSAFFSLALNQTWDIKLIIDTLIIALTANFINLLDVSPGRAAKGSIILLFFLFIVQMQAEIFVTIYPAFIMLSVYLIGDVREDFMMGDVGSNGIGGFIGGVSAIYLSLEIKITYLIFLVSFHILTEYLPFSKMIKKSKLLTALDNLGRN